LRYGPTHRDQQNQGYEERFSHLGKASKTELTVAQLQIVG
jgi:hypothetical protein